MRASKARTGRSTGYAWHRRWLAYGASSPWIPEVGAVCGKAARTDLCGGRPVMDVPTAIDAQDERRILGALDAPPPAGYARWNGPLLGKHLGDISKHQIWRVLREHEISLERRRSWR